MIKAIIASALLIFSLATNAKESAKDLGLRFVTCSADAVTLSKMLKNKDHRVRVIDRSDKWFMASMFSFIESGLNQYDAWDYSSSLLEEKIAETPLEEIADNHQAMVEYSEKLIYAINENCLPYDEYVENLLHHYLGEPAQVSN